MFISTARVGSLGLLVLAAVLPVAHGQSADCTTEQNSAFDSVAVTEPLKCKFQLNLFEVCDDDCFAAKSKLLSIAPNCTGATAMTKYELAKSSLDQCEEARANSTDKYIPHATAGLTQCDLDQLSGWEQKYGAGTNASSCAKATTECSDACLATIEESITKAPVCADVSGYWVGETKKRGLVRCILARGGDLATNSVLQSVASGDGSMVKFNVTPAPAASSKAPATTSPTQSEAPTTTSAAASVAQWKVLTISVSSIVLASYMA